MKRAAICALILTAILASLGLGQEKVRPAFSPIPLWLRDGNIPDAMKKHHVFFSPETNEVIVSIEGPTGRRTLRFELHNKAEAIVNSQLSRQNNGLYVYEYTVSAGNTTERLLKTWSLLIPADDLQFQAQPAAAWSAEQLKIDQC